MIRERPVQNYSSCGVWEVLSTPPVRTGQSPGQGILYNLRARR